MKTIAFPLQGQWKFLRPPGHHQFAFDFIQVGKGKMHKEKAINFIFSSVPSERYLCWGKPVFSPIDGKVLHCSNDWPDHRNNNVIESIKRWYNATYKFKPEEKNGFLDIRPNAGNYLMIESDQGYIVFLAHLKYSSLTVSKGQRVNIGQKIGEVGNSGNSTAPHLHINLFDQMDDPIKSEVIPFVFDSYQELMSDDTWLTCNNSTPKVKSIVRHSVES